MPDETKVTNERNDKTRRNSSKLRNAAPHPWFNGEANSTEGLLLALYVSNICVDGVTTTPEYLWSLISVDGSSRTFWLCSRNFVLYWIRLCRGPRGPARIMSRVSVNSI